MNHRIYCKAMDASSMLSFSPKCWLRCVLFVCFGLIAVSSMGQQALGMRPRVKSPVLNADGTVTFNFFEIGRASCRERVYCRV